MPDAHLAAGMWVVRGSWGGLQLGLTLMIPVLIAGCSSASELRRSAERQMPSDGPVAAAGANERIESRAEAAPIAAERPLPEPLSINDCVLWALEHNRDLRGQISVAERSRLDITSARSETYAPRLTASAGRTLTSDAAGTERSDEAEARIALSTNLLGFTLSPYVSGSWDDPDTSGDPTPYTGAVGISLARRLFSLHEDARLSARLTQADRSYAKAVNSLALRCRRMALDAARAFYDLQKAETRIRLRESRLDQAKVFLASVQESVAAGLKAPVEETNALIDFNQAEANLLSDRQSVANARDRLLSLLDRPLGGEIVIQPADVTGVRPVLPELANDITRVLTQHEDLLNLRIEVEQSRDDTAIALDRLAPQVTATASAARHWEGDQPSGFGQTEDVVALKLELDMPLDAWAGERAGLRKQERQQRELRLRMRSSEMDLERQVRELRRRIEVQLRTVQLSIQRLEAERAKFAATEASYRTGRVDNLELTRARETVDRAEVDLLEARIDLVLALAEREALVPPEAPR